MPVSTNSVWYQPSARDSMAAADSGPCVAASQPASVSAMERDQSDGIKDAKRMNSSRNSRTVEKVAQSHTPRPHCARSKGKTYENLAVSSNSVSTAPQTALQCSDTGMRDGQIRQSARSGMDLGQGLWVDRHRQRRTPAIQTKPERPASARTLRPRLSISRCTQSGPNLVSALPSHVDSPARVPERAGAAATHRGGCRAR